MFAGHSRAVVHMSVHTGSDSTYKSTQVLTGQNPSVERGSGHTVSHLAEELVVMDG